MLTVENANLHYAAAQALRGISLHAEMGRITCVLGRNGVGKSSLLRAVTGQHPLSGGKISFEGKAMNGMAILLVEQYLDFCRELADHVYIMNRGEIVHEGPAERWIPRRLAGI